MLEPTPNLPCPLCGAPLGPETCEARFHACLALEYEHPTAYGAVHHLTVLCWMLQHNGYNQQSWLAARHMLAQFVHSHISPAAMRQQNGRSLNGRSPASSLLKGPKLPQFASLVWSRTLADVRLDTPEHYVADVRLWASAILADTQCLNLPPEQENFHEQRPLRSI